MNFFHFFTKKQAPIIEQPVNEDAEILPEYEVVIVQFFYGIEDISDLHKLEAEINSLLSQKSIGEYKGHEISLDFGDGYLFLIGSNAHDLFNHIRPTLENHYFMDKAIVTLRNCPFEKSNAKEIDLRIRYHKLVTE